VTIGSGVLLPGVAENPTFPILNPLAYRPTTGLGYRPTCDYSDGDDDDDDVRWWQWWCWHTWRLSLSQILHTVHSHL